MLAGLEWADLAVVMLAAITVGAQDASVGSGGAVLLPALLAVTPAVTPAGVSAAVPLALNKAVAVAGNVVAAARRAAPP